MKLLKLSLLFLLLHIGAAAAIGPQEQTVSIKIGKEAILNGSGLKVRFVEVIEDSRCPEGTNCIWAGVAKIKIQLRWNGKTAVFELNTNQTDKVAVFGGYEVKLASVTPHPKANTTFQRSTYTARLSISKLSK